MFSKIKYNKTKIVATVGPAIDNIETLKTLISSGVNVFRINFSHSTHENHAMAIANIRKASDIVKVPVSILGDLQGPKLRIGGVDNNFMEVKKGESVILTVKECISKDGKIYVKYPNLAKEVLPGESVLLDDGKLNFEFTEIIDEYNVKAKVISGGVLSSNKGFNLPSTKMSVEALTAKDRKDLKFILTEDFDWVALSFVRAKEDIVLLRKIINDAGRNLKIISKIEKPQAVENLDEILDVTDGIMVARGDLGVEMPMEKVPVIQKKIVQKCIEASKPVIIATQMMESMINSPTPTRAETSDVANSVMDGADAVMLSAETSVGKYPINTIEAVEKILGNAETGWDVYNRGNSPSKSSPTFLSDEICYTAVQMSRRIGAKAIVSMTQTGYTAYKIASFRPDCDIFIFTANKKLITQLNLLWNVRVFFYDLDTNTDDTVTEVLEILKKENLIKVDDVVVHTAAMPVKENRKTNTLKISRVR
jgi:pyruvate kinase